MNKRLVSMMLAVSMTLSLVPVPAFAAAGDSLPDTAVSTAALGAENAAVGTTVALNEMIAGVFSSSSDVGENDCPRYPYGCGKNCDQAVQGTGWSYKPYEAPAGGFGEYDVRGVLILEEGYTFTLDSDTDLWIECDIENHGTIDGRGESRTITSVGGDYVMTARLETYGNIVNYGTISNTLIRQWSTTFSGQELQNQPGAVIRGSCFFTPHHSGITNDGTIENCMFSYTNKYTYAISGSGSISQSYFDSLDFTCTNDCSDNIFVKDPGFASGVYTISDDHDRAVTCEIPDTVEAQSTAHGSKHTFYFTGSPVLRVTMAGISSINGVALTQSAVIPGVKTIQSIQRDGSDTTVVLVPDGTQNIVLHYEEGADPEPDPTPTPDPKPTPDPDPKPDPDPTPTPDPTPDPKPDPDPEPTPDPDPTPADSTTSPLAAIVETGAWLTGGAFVTYEIVTTRYLSHALPEGSAIPTNRAELAVLLWQNAGKPEPALPAQYADVTEPDTAKAARWAVEAGLLPDKGTDTFAPGRFVSKLQVIRAWNQLRKLNTAQ